MSDDARLDDHPLDDMTPQECENGKHPDWAIEGDTTIFCPWCRLDAARAENHRLDLLAHHWARKAEDRYAEVRELRTERDKITDAVVADGWKLVLVDRTEDRKYADVYQELYEQRAESLERAEADLGIETAVNGTATPDRRVLVDPADEETVERVADVMFYLFQEGRRIGSGITANSAARAVLAELGKGGER